MKSPIALADFGSFYVGGRQVRIEGRPTHEIAFTETASITYDPNGTYHVEQAYVQYFIPAEQRHPLPVVMLHGGGMTGTMWERTPDGRPGWLHDFLRMGHAVYVVDNVERGRAGWTPFEEVWPDPPIIRSAEEAWSLFRIGTAQDYAARKPFAEQKFPVGYFDAFIRYAVPRWVGNNDAALRGFCAVLDRVGPCVAMAHSHGGEVAFRAARERPALVRAVVAIEPSGFASGAERDEEEQSVLLVYGDYLDATPLWKRLTAAGADHARRLAEEGKTVEHLALPSLGAPGNSHFPMMDSNSQEISAWISDWMFRHCRQAGGA